jgi:hypothetical protein
MVGRKIRIMRSAIRNILLVGASILMLAAGGVVGWFGIGVYKAMAVRQPNAYAMQSAGQLIVEHMRLHSGAWPKSWTELRDTCATSHLNILSPNADTEIEELRKRVEIDWSVNPELIRRRVLQSNSIPISVVRLKDGRHDSFVGAEPNQMILNYLFKTNDSGAGLKPRWF